MIASRVGTPQVEAMKYSNKTRPTGSKEDWDWNISHLREYTTILDKECSDYNTTKLISKCAYPRQICCFSTLLSYWPNRDLWTIKNPPFVFT